MSWKWCARRKLCLKILQWKMTVTENQRDGKNISYGIAKFNDKSTKHITIKKLLRSTKYIGHGHCKSDKKEGELL